jgi:hypothetical protein
MKSFLIGLTTLMSISAFAKTGWEEANRSAYEAETKPEIEELLVLYPSVKVDIQDAEMDPNNLSYVEVIETRYKFMGETVCAANDPRLTANLISFTACEESENDDEIDCLASIIQILSDSDPCEDRNL